MLNVNGRAMALEVSSIRPVSLAEFDTFKIKRLGSFLKTIPASRNDNTCNTLDMVPFGIGRSAAGTFGKDCGSKFHCTEREVLTVRQIDLLQMIFSSFQSLMILRLLLVVDIKH